MKLGFWAGAAHAAGFPASLVVGAQNNKLVIALQGREGEGEGEQLGSLTTAQEKRGSIPGSNLNMKHAFLYIMHFFVSTVLHIPFQQLQGVCFI